MLQAYPAPPFNITSGVTTVQGTAGRPIVDGEFIERNAGVGTAFFTLSARISRNFRLTPRWQLEILAEGFNLTNRANVVTRNTNFGPGAYPDNPSPTYRPDHGRRRPSRLPVRRALALLSEDLMKRYLCAVAAVAALTALFPLRPSAQTGIGATLAIAGATNQTPWVAAHGSLVAVVWGASAPGKADVFSAISRDGGVTFGSPVRVNAVAGEARVSGEIAPRVAWYPAGYRA